MDVEPARITRTARVRPRPSPRTPTVTVVIPCFNYADYVGDAIRSVLTQEGVRPTVVVVDDRSTDDSADIVAVIAAGDPRVRLVRHRENAGPVRTFNDGLALAEGEFVVRLDADDLLTPGSLARAIAVADAHPSVGLVYGHPLHFSGTELPVPRTHSTGWILHPGGAWLEERCRTGVNVVTSPEVLMRRSVVDVVGGQRDLPHTHDMEMWLRIASVSDVAYITGADQAWHREHGRSLSQSLDPRFGDLQDRLDAFDTLFGWTAGRLADTERLHLLARRTLADEALRTIVHLHDRNKTDAGLLDRYLRFVSETPTGPEPLPHARETERLLRRGPRRPALWQVVRAGGRRIRNELEWARWHRQGVFTRDR